MTTASRIRPHAPKIDAELVEAFKRIQTSIISDNLARLVSAGPQIRPFHGSAAMAGTALTVRTRPGDNLFIHKAIDIVEPGQVIVIDGGGSLSNALIGEIMMRIAVKNGAAGFVIDGAIRDAGAFREAQVPCFARGVNHRGPYKDGPGDINVPVPIGDMIVHPGDLVVGDEDGVVAVRPDELQAVLPGALAQVKREADTLQSIAAGTIDRAWVDQTLKSRGYA
jgi:RraA family protein